MALVKLPDDALEAVLRHLSLRPRSSDWATHIPPEAVCSLSEASGTDSAPIRLLQRRVHALSTLVTNPSNAAALLRTLELLCHCTRLDVAVHASGRCLPINSQLQELTLTLAASAPSPGDLLVSLPHLRVLRVDVSPTHASQLYETVSAHCSGLHELELHVGFRTARGLRSMFASLRDLRKLTLVVRDAMLAEDADSEPLTFEPLINGELEELTVHGDLRGARADFERLILNSPHLKCLTMPHIGMQPAFAAQLAAACPQVQVQSDALPLVRSLDDYLHAERCDPTSVMQVLGKQLTAFAFRGGFRPASAFVDAAAMCTALCVLSVVDLGRDALTIIGALFATPRPALRELRLAFVCQSAPMAECLHMVATNTGGLESLELTGTKQPAHVYALIAQRNAQLSGVRVVLRDVTDKVASVGGTMDAFGSLPLLSTLTIDTFSLPAQAQLPRDIWFRCRKLRAKLIDVRVDGRSTR